MFELPRRTMSVKLDAPWRASQASNAPPVVVISYPLIDRVRLLCDDAHDTRLRWRLGRLGPEFAAASSGARPLA